MNSDFGGGAALYIASQLGHAQLVRLLAENGATLDARSGHGATAAFVAALNDKPASLRALAEAGADFDIPENENKSPLRIALEEGNVECVRELARGGADISDALQIQNIRIPNKRAIVGLLNKISLAGGEWEDYVASLRMPFILIRKSVRCGGNRVGGQGPESAVLNWVFDAPAPAPVKGEAVEAAVRPCPPEIFAEVVRWLVE